MKARIYSIILTFTLGLTSLILILTALAHETVGDEPRNEHLIADFEDGVITIVDIQRLAAQWGAPCQ